MRLVSSFVALISLVMLTNGCAHIVCNKDQARHKVLSDKSIPTDEKEMRIKTLNMDEERCIEDFRAGALAMGNAMQEAGRNMQESAYRNRSINCTSTRIGDQVYTHCQ